MTAVANPTWYSDIRHLFNQTDIAHMSGQDMDLTSYSEVSQAGGTIYGQLATKQMPPASAGGPWPDDQIQTFLNWMSNGYPKGTNQPAIEQYRAAKEQTPNDAPTTAATRIRKEITSLSAAELEMLTKAFTTIMALPSTDPNSYFVQAGYHWLPAPTYCQHHAPAYNPWHRAFLVSFENALRSVPGCEDVTLPYWDITKPFPDVLKSAPFEEYVLPEGVGDPRWPAGYVTQRNAYADIAQKLLDNDVVADLKRALTKTDWEDFHGGWGGASFNTIIAAHDGGHVSIGPTMAAQSVAAFDPVFWFFHCNWDRLFWEWQKQMQATNLTGLMQTIDKTNDPVSYDIFTVPALQQLAPFSTPPLNLNTLNIIDSENSLDIDYTDPDGAEVVDFLAKTNRVAPASQSLTVHTDRANVRVQGVNRLAIPGSFTVHLLKDGKRIASRSMFQPDAAEKCENCAANPIANFDFELPLDAVAGGKLSVEVEPADKSVVGDRFPHKLMGSPTVEISLLTTTEE